MTHPVVPAVPSAKAEKGRETPQCDDLFNRRVALLQKNGQWSNGDGDSFLSLARTLERERGELIEALQHAVEHVKAWHNMGIPDEQAQPMWDIYWNNSPEMESLRELLLRLTPPSGREQK